MSDASALTVTGLTKVYGEAFRLGPVSLALAPGQTVGVLGKNGSGKTTLFQLLTGNQDATDGEVRLGGKRLTPDTPELKRRLGYLPQNPQLPRWATGRELLDYAASLYGLADARERVPAAMRKWDCESYATKPLMTLSFGMQKRVGLALATLHDPAVLILDEPYSGLDLVHIRTLDGEILRRARSAQTTILSTHVLAFCARHCDEVLIVEGGQARALEPWHGLDPGAREAAIEAAFFPREVRA